MRWVGLLLVLTACAGMGEKDIVSGGEAGGVVSNTWNRGDAYYVAEMHCARYGKATRITDFENHAASFECVPKD